MIQSKEDTRVQMKEKLMGEEGKESVERKKPTLLKATFISLTANMMFVHC